MDRLFWTALSGLVGAILFYYGNRLYLRLAMGEQPTKRSLIGAVSLTGLAAGFLFFGLIGLMSSQNQADRWSSQNIAGIVMSAVIVSLVVAGVTGVKIYAFRRLKRGGTIQIEDLPDE